MDEMLELRRYLEEGRYDDALLIIDEMEEMAKDDKITTIGNYLVVLLTHLIKRHAERRDTRSWRNAILNSLANIRKANKRRSTGDAYLSVGELREAIEENVEEALRNAAAEAFEGVYSEQELLRLVDEELIKSEALKYILDGYKDYAHS